MSYDDNVFGRFKEYLRKIKDIKDDRCWICNRTPDKLRKDFYEFKKNPPQGFEEIELEDIFVITYADKIRHPVCFNCYFNIRENPDLIKEIMEKSEDEIW